MLLRNTLLRVIEISFWVFSHTLLDKHFHHNALLLNGRSIFFRGIFSSSGLLVISINNRHL